MATLSLNKEPSHDLEVARVAVTSLRAHPENARRGNVEEIAGSLARLGQYRPVIVNRGTFTGRPAEILAGHHIVKAAASLGWDQVAVSYVDVDDSTARRILAADNRLPELGGFDNDSLLALLENVGDLGGTGYAPGDLDDLRVLLERAGGIGEPPPADATDAKPGKSSGGVDFENTWKNESRRIMILDVPVEVFVWLQDGLAGLAAQWQLDSNVDVVLRLLAAATGVDPPEGVAHASS